MSTTKNLDNLSSILYDKSFMMQHFDTLTPNISERTLVFFELWRRWKDCAIKLKHRNEREFIRELKGLGLVEHFEFQVRGAEVRFANNELKSIAVLSGIKGI